LVTTVELNQLGETYSTVRGDVTTLHLSTAVGSDNFTYVADSQPYNPQNSSDSTHGWIRKKYDANGRIVATDYFQGAASPFPWGSNSTNIGTQTATYVNNQTTVTDEAGNSRLQAVDGLGRLTSVTEDPAGCPNSTNNSGIGCLNYLTSYTYDFGDRLTGVTQGTEGRSFTYDSAGRLTSAQNPETGEITYSVYDGNGNLKQKTDGRQITTYMTYDLLNRLTGKTYSDTTPSATYCYDAPAQSPGTCAKSVPAGDIYHLTEAYTSAVSSSLTPSTVTDYTAFDHLGRITSDTQTIGTTAVYPFSYSYNWQDAVATLTYPSQRVVFYGFDNSGRVLSVSNNTNGPNGPLYASNTLYWGHGAIEQMTLEPAGGTQVTETSTIDARMRMTGLAASGGSTSFNLGYTYFPNGNVQTHTVQGLTQTFSYDAVNRLIGASEAGGASPEWNQSFSYDQWGNRALLTTSSFNPYSGITPQASPSGTWVLGQNYNAPVFNANNQIVAATYKGGNQMSNLATTGDSATYDAENRLSTITEMVGSGFELTQYTYDANGRRVLKATCTSGANCGVTTTGASVTYYVYDAQGDLAAEYGAPTDSGTKYLVTDALGSTRLEVDSNGNTTKCLDYAPFGNEIPQGVGGRGACYAKISYPGSPDTIDSKFTGKLRDNESGLDFFGARYFSAAQGRFTSPDWSEKPQPVPYADLKDPQTLNLYVYVRNNPLSRRDADGHCDSSAKATANTKCQDVSDLKVNDAMKNKLKQSEGLPGTKGDPALKVYKDGAGNLTVGWGHKVTAADGMKEGDTIKTDQAQKLFDSDLSSKEGAVANVLTSNGGHQFSQGEFNALVDLTYNGGPGMLTTDASPNLMKDMNAGDYDAMAGQLQYTKDSAGKVEKGLVTRSDDRKDIFLGEDPE
jgi:RHS repeat-associated protein